MLSPQMGHYWRNFAHTSDPNSGPATPAAAWPAFAGADDAQPTLQLDVGHISPVHALRKGQCDLFESAWRR